MASPQQRRKTRADEITVKQTKFVKALVEGKSKRQAALEAYDTTDPAVASQIAKDNMKKPAVQQALAVALEKHGLTPDSIVGVVADGMKAEKVVIIGKDEDAFADVQPDHNVRLKAAGMAANFMGIGKETTPTVNISFNQIAQEQREKYGL